MASWAWPPLLAVVGSGIGTGLGALLWHRVTREGWGWARTVGVSLAVVAAWSVANATADASSASIAIAVASLLSALGVPGVMGVVRPTRFPIAARYTRWASVGWVGLAGLAASDAALAPALQGMLKLGVTGHAIPADDPALAEGLRAAGQTLRVAWSPPGLGPDVTVSMSHWGVLAAVIGGVAPGSAGGLGLLCVMRFPRRAWCTLGVGIAAVWLAIRVLEPFGVWPNLGLVIAGLRGHPSLSPLSPSVTPLTAELLWGVVAVGWAGPILLAWVCIGRPGPVPEREVPAA